MFDAARVLEGFCEGYDGNITFSHDYSGRGMYGSTCPGIAVNDGTQPFELALALAEYVSETEDIGPYELSDILGGSRTESLGLGTSSTSHAQPDTRPLPGYLRKGPFSASTRKNSLKSVRKDLHPSATRANTQPRHGAETKYKPRG